MALNVDSDYLINSIGHDGSDIAWPSESEPRNRVAFHPQEFILPALQLKFYVMQIELNPISMVSENLPYHYVNNENNFDYLLNTFNNGVLTGTTNQGKDHAVYWNGLECLDINGIVKLFKATMFFPVIKIQ